MHGSATGGQMKGATGHQKGAQGQKYGAYGSDIGGHWRSNVAETIAKKCRASGDQIL
jgi:hypothetical protein